MYDMGRELVARQFNDIIASGEKPSLEQRAELSAQDPLHFSDRSKNQVVDQLKDCLFQLNQKGGYNEALRVKAYDLLIVILPRTGADLSQVNEYITQYRTALAKHREEALLGSNFR